MHKTSPLAVVMQQLDDLSLAELLAVQARVSALIQGKSSDQKPFSTVVSHHTGTKIQVRRTLPVAIPALSETQDIHTPKCFYSLVKQSQYQVEQIFELKTDEDDSLEKVINLVDEWMNDESGYDEETYPQIEAALNQNHLSI